jgi:osmotically-inducible protein OsmY
MKLLLACMMIAFGATAAPAYTQELPADPARSPATETPAKVDPAVAAANVTKALKAVKGVPAGAVTVATHAGIVVLSGELDTEAQRAAAQAAAEKAAAGVRISSNIQVRAPEDRSPKEQLAAQQSAQLVREVELALKADSRTSGLGIIVSSAEAYSVVLQGLVHTRETRTTVQNVVSQVKGVTRLDNRVLVLGEPIPAARP